uniref:RRM domain-containing protein n=2 Tax=Arion vulgaris TaxID=1028688 RepID=A0A0B7AJ07_9EUPU
MLNLVSGTLIEKTVTLSKLPKAATKDFVGALFPFATEIEIIESDNPDERKATVKCKTPVTSLLVYKSFKRLEINDVHVKLSIDDSVKAITLPPMFFIPPPDKKDTGPPDSIESLNQSSLHRRPVMNSLNRRVQLIKKRAIFNRKLPTRGQFIRGQRPNQGFNDQMGEGIRGPPPHRPLPRRDGTRFGSDKMQGPVGRDYPIGPGRRRMMERQNDRRNRGNDRDSRESNVTKEMLQLQNQLNQAIKNQLAMLNKSPTGNHVQPHNFPIPGTSHKTPLLGHGPRHFGGDGVGAPSSSRGIEQHHHHQPDFGGASWTPDRGGRINRVVRNDHTRPERIVRAGVDGMDRASRPDSKRMDMNIRMDNQSSRIERSSRDRTNKADPARHRRQTQAFGGSSTSDAGRNKGERSSLNRSHGSERSSSNVRRGPDYPGSDINTQRNDRTYSSSSHGQTTGSNRFGTYNQTEGENSFFRHY